MPSLPVLNNHHALVTRRSTRITCLSNYDRVATNLYTLRVKPNIELVQPVREPDLQFLATSSYAVRIKISIGYCKIRLDAST